MTARNGNTPEANGSEGEKRSVEYEAYLVSAAWKNLRSKALMRDDFACRVCNRQKRLDVHHRTYERFGNEKLDDLTTLCRGCHDVFHEHRRLAPRVNKPQVEQRKERKAKQRRERTRTSGAQTKRSSKKRTGKKLKQLGNENEQLHETQRQAALRREARKGMRHRRELGPELELEEIRRRIREDQKEQRKKAAAARDPRTAGQPIATDKFSLRAQGDREVKDAA